MVLRITILFFLVFFNYNSILTSQHVMVLKDQTIYKVEKLKSYPEYFLYTPYGIGISMYIPREEVLFIEEYSGELSDYRNPKIFSTQKKMSLKISLTAFARQSFITSLGKSISPRFGIETSIKLHSSILKGYSYEQASGWAIEAGIIYKIMNPYGTISNNTYRHIMSGPYLKPSIGFSYRKENNYEDTDQYKVFYSGLNMGYQIVIRNSFIIDIYAGAYYYTGKGTTSPNPENRFTIPSRISLDEGDLSGKNNFATSFGVKAGVFLGRKG